MPEEIYALMDLYPQPPQRRPTAGYVPLPNHRPRPRRKTARSYNFGGKNSTNVPMPAGAFLPRNHLLNMS
ncbi:SDH family Clp fold serine proteinase [Kyrpidia tusciae]|uniref:SDH family Clp fold serine proteinase n=1 Tax=Kyrpidia tusciae TaxID=33943 RepID=UPI001C54D589